MSSDDLAAFLGARYAEAWGEARDCELLKGLHESRGTRDIDAKREILAMWQDQAGYDLPEGVHDGRDPDERERDESLKGTLETVVRHLGTEFSDHPDYRQEWKP